MPSTPTAILPALRPLLPAAVLALAASNLHAQTVLFDGSTSTSWLTASNWTPSHVPTATEIAQFGAQPAAGIVAIGMHGGTNNGPNNQAAAAFWLTSTRTTNLTVGNSSTSAGGIFTFTGANIPGVGDTAIYHNGGTAAAPTTLTFQNAVGGGTMFMDVALPGGGNVRIRTGNGLTGANEGNVIRMDSAFHSLQHFNVLGGGNGSNRPGTLFLNTTGNTLRSFTVGSADGLDAGCLRLAFFHQPDAGNYTWTINPHSQLRLDSGGLGFWPGDPLVLKSMGLASAGANILHGGLRTIGTATIPGLVQLQANAGIHNEANLTLNQGVTQSGGTFSLTKTGPGNLILTQPSTYGDTVLSAGSITIDAGNNRLPTGSGLTVAAGATLALGTSSAARSQQLRALAGAGSVIGAANANSTLTLSGGSSVFGGLLGGTGTNHNRLALTITGGASLDLARAAGNTYLGNTAVNAGSTLRVSNTSGSATGAGNVTVAAGGRLEGAGSFTGALTCAGTVAPGTPTLRAALTSGNTTLSPGSTLVLDLLSAADYDSLNVVGTASISGANLALTAAAAYVPAATDRFWILTNNAADAVSGAFAGLSQNAPVLINGTTFRISYQGDSATGAITGGNDVVLFVPSIPAAALLGLGGLCAARRRRAR